MKKIVIAAALAFALHGNAQKLPELNEIYIKTSADAVDYAGEALQVAEYILATPPSKTGDRAQAENFLMQWMKLTPDYHFAFNAKYMILENNPELQPVYMASMVRYQVSNKQQKVSDDELMTVYTDLAEYTLEPKNKITAKGKLIQLVEAYQKGTIKQFLGMQ